MKIALLLAGQARQIDKLPYHNRSVLRFISQYKPDVYCSFWDSLEARSALQLFEPKSYILSTEAEFQLDKQDWWDRWSKLVSGKTDIQHRRKRYWDEIPTLKSRENTIRHWSRLTSGVHLLRPLYDVVVTSRTDIFLRHDPIIGAVEPMKLYAANRSEWSMIDLLFWGTNETICKLLNWERMIKAMAHAELNGKYGRRPMALARDSRWLGPENTLMLVMQYLGIEYVKQPFRTEIIR